MPLPDDYINEFSTYTFVFATATQLEQHLIEQVKTYVDRLKERNVFKTELGDVLVNAVYNKELAKSHQIVIEFIPTNIMPVTFGNIVKREEDVAGETWLKYMGKWNYTLEITCRSMNRNAVAILADIILVGLMKPIRDNLLEIGVEIPINNVGMNRIVPDREPGFENLFRLVLTVSEIYIDWVQLYREDGKIAQEIGVDISQI